MAKSSPRYQLHRVWISLKTSSQPHSALSELPFSISSCTLNPQSQNRGLPCRTWLSSLKRSNRLYARREAPSLTDRFAPGTSPFLAPRRALPSLIDASGIRASSRLFSSTECFIGRNVRSASSDLSPSAGLPSLSFRCVRNSCSGVSCSVAAVNVWKNRRGLSGGRAGVEAEAVDCVVIGAGVAGLAIARELAKKGRDVVVVEAAEGIGTGTSSRNSEVIHAGIYYPPGSLKARLCVEGRELMYAYCKERDVPHMKVSKLVVATGSHQIPVLERLAGLGKASGVMDLRMISGEEAMQMEPALQCVKALLSPSTGIVDSHSFMLALQTDAEQLGVAFAFNSAVIKGSVTPRGIEIDVVDSSSLASRPSSQFSDVGETTTLLAKTVINAAGLFAQSVARRIDGLPAQTIPKAFYCKGCYFYLSGVSRPPFTRLVYPVPEDGGVGVHVTMDLGGQTRFGPDVEWLPHLQDDAMFPAQFDYVVDSRRGDKFYAEIRKFYPALPDEALQPGYSGMRSKISGQGQPAADFLIQGEDTHGISGLIHLYGIESPGLTSSLGIAKLVCNIVEK